MVDDNDDLIKVQKGCDVLSVSFSFSSKERGGKKCVCFFWLCFVFGGWVEASVVSEKVGIGLYEDPWNVEPLD